MTTGNDGVCRLWEFDPASRLFSTKVVFSLIFLIFVLIPFLMAFPFSHHSMTNLFVAQGFMIEH